jgi:hypothetical protein
MLLEELEKYYEELLKADLKVIPEKVTTLFDIADFRHYETVMSNFYSFYLDPNGQHGFNDLFISALSDIIKRKTGGHSIIANSKICYTEREVNRKIDIVVSEPSEFDDVVENAIIIENKVNAPVYNDLMEYYNSIKVNKNKIGVVLSLRQEADLPEEFINITHDEFINQVEQSSGSYFLNADLKQVVILKEFIQNIKNMSQTKDLKEHYEFFFKHQDKIKKISDLYSTIKSDIFKQVDDVCEKLNEKLNLGLELQGRQLKTPLLFPLRPHQCILQFGLTDLFNGDGKIYIFVELNEEGISHLDKINKIKFTDNEKKLLDETTKVRKTYIHYATKELKPSPEDIKDFTNYIYNQITQTPLIDIFLKIEKLLKDEK